MKDITSQLVARYINSLQAQFYDMAFIHANENVDTLKIRLTYTPQQLLKAVEYMKKMNMDNYHIYCRPVGLQYILPDDIEFSKLSDLAKLKPCLLIETSPKNYQAWLKLKNCPTDYESALTITRELQIRLDSDKAAVSPKQVGRLPGFTNRKPKYKNRNGLYPFVKLKKWNNRFSDFTHSGARALKIQTVLTISIVISQAILSNFSQAIINNLE